MPPAVPLTQFLAAGGGKMSWADEEGDASAPAALPSYSRAPSDASGAPAAQPATKTIPAVGPFVVFVGNVSYDIEQARPAARATRRCVRNAARRKPSPHAHPLPRPYRASRRAASRPHGRADLPSAARRAE